MSSDGLDLKSFKIPLGRVAPLTTFKTRQGDTLSYRLYPAWSEDLVILYHGVGSDSRYMCLLAAALAEAKIATVVTPDFRCHGGSRELSDKISGQQLEIDLEELIVHLKSQRAVSRITLAGHSMGGGFVLRVAVSDIRQQFAKFVAIAPYLPPDFNVHVPGYAGWITFDEQGGFRVNMAELFRTGQEKLSYSAEYVQAVAPPPQLLSRLENLKPAVCIVSGERDEVNQAIRYQEIFAPLKVPVDIVPGLNHLTIVAKPAPYLAKF
ncbi:MAG: alpha/beta hydrolase [Bdellovibrio sp.]|nr:alpha/beta hydrolase [Bdellovibrio sp.]